MRKWCSSCRQEKPGERFGKATKARDGLQYWCRECMAERARARRKGVTCSTVAGSRKAYATVGLSDSARTPRVGGRRRLPQRPSDAIAGSSAGLRDADADTTPEAEPGGSGTVQALELPDAEAEAGPVRDAVEPRTSQPWDAPGKTTVVQKSTAVVDELIPAQLELCGDVSPEYRLQVAVLEDALASLQYFSKMSERSDRRVRLIELWEWFAKPYTSGAPFSLGDVCLSLNIDTERVSRIVLARYAETFASGEVEDDDQTIAPSSCRYVPGRNRVDVRATGREKAHL